MEEPAGEPETLAPGNGFLRSLPHGRRQSYQTNLLPRHLEWKLVPGRQELAFTTYFASSGLGVRPLVQILENYGGRLLEAMRSGLPRSPRGRETAHDLLAVLHQRTSCSAGSTSMRMES